MSTPHRRPYGLIIGWSLPVLAVLLGDLVLSMMVVPEVLDGRLVVELIAHSLLQLLAVVGFGGFLLALLALAWMALLSVCGRQWSFWGRAVLVAAGWIITDQLIYGHLVTRHWTFPLLRLASALLAAFILGAHWWIRRVRPQRLAGLHLIVSSFVTVGIAATWFSLGTSASVFTPKYLREPTAALLLLFGQLLWVQAALRVRPTFVLRRRAWLLGGILVFLLATSVTSVLSARSHYVVVTYLECVRATRSFNRQVTRLPPFRYLSWLRASLGDPPRAVARVKARGSRLTCERIRAGLTESVLLVTVDSLRSDYYGVPAARLPAFQQLRARSLEFRRTYQVVPATDGSLGALRRGRYLMQLAPSLRLHRVARSLSLLTPDRYLKQRPKETELRFAKRIFDRFTRLQLKAEGRGVLLHAHFLSLHLTAYKPFARHDYRRILRRTDAALGRLFGRLERSPWARSTAVILTADHGEELRSERGTFSHASDVTETLLRTPLFLYVPRVRPHTRLDAVSALDVFPTILQLVGARCNYPTHGRSLLRPPLPGRVLFGSSAGAARPRSRPRYTDRHMALQWPYKLVYDRGENVFALYDVSRDYLQRRNLVDRFPERRKQLWRLLKAYLEGRLPAQ